MNSDPMVNKNADSPTDKGKKKLKKAKLTHSRQHIRSHTSEGEGSSKLSNSKYEKELARLQLELVKMLAG
jgi:polyphosphate kinase 2 (PPK2 family)